jgi:protein associated with RNAse G/E
MATPQTALFRPGQQIRYTACKADGLPYRWNTAWIAEVRPDCILLEIPPGVLVEGEKYGRPTKYRARHYIWPDRPYNLFESYDPDGTPRYLYLNVASRPILTEGEIRYTDYELDLTRRYGEEDVNLLDEDEFTTAITQYGYSPGFQADLWAAVAEARTLLEGWTWHPEGAPPLYQPGQTVRMSACKADGHPYRWMAMTVVSAQPGYVVLHSAPGVLCEGPKGGWRTRYEGQVHLWAGRPYNLTEVFAPEGHLIELYVNIASPAELLPGEVRYTDYELDVTKRPGQPARVADEDEFQEAIQRYGYTEEFQKTCWKAVTEALELVETWPLNKG